MKYLKTLGLLTIVAAAFMASTGASSATITSPAGTAYSGPVKLTSSNFFFDGSVDISCAHSLFEGTVSEGSTTINLSSVTFSECGKDTWVAVDEGSLAISSDGTVTSTGMILTTQLHRVVVGIPITTHCIFTTNKTNVGTLTEGANAILHFLPFPIAMEETDAACGNDAILGGTYSVTTPSYLAVD